MTAIASTEARTRVLVIDDDVKLCRLIRDYLEPMGYEVATVHNGAEGLERARKESFAALILDVMLPGLDGLEVLRRLRAESHVPVLMLTGRGDEPDRIVGLELGADDYLPKTFSTRELLARLRAVIRRSMLSEAAANRVKDTAQPTLTVGSLAIDSSARTAALNGEAVLLTAVGFDLLLSLATAAGRVKTREQLLLEVADRDFDVFDRSIDVHISRLRHKLESDPKNPQYLKTIRGVGYMLAPEER